MCEGVVSGCSIEDFLETWLAASDNLCRVCLFKLSDCLSSSASDESRRLSHCIQLQDPVFAMRTVDQLLVGLIYCHIEDPACNNDWHSMCS